MPSERVGEGHKFSVRGNRSDDLTSTKPKVTGSNPVGRTFQVKLRSAFYGFKGQVLSTSRCALSARMWLPRPPTDRRGARDGVDP